MKRVKDKYMDVAILLQDQLVALVVEFCVDCDTKKFEKKYWGVIKRKVKLAGKVRNTRSLIEG